MGTAEQRRARSDLAFMKSSGLRSRHAPCSGGETRIRLLGVALCSELLPTAPKTQGNWANPMTPTPISRHPPQYSDNKMLDQETPGIRRRRDNPANGGCRMPNRPKHDNYREIRRGPAAALCCSARLVRDRLRAMSPPIWPCKNPQS